MALRSDLQPGAGPDLHGEEPLDPALADAMAQVPRGAVALAGVALALVLAAWLLVYFAFYLPRGTVG